MEKICSEEKTKSPSQQNPKKAHQSYMLSNGVTSTFGTLLRSAAAFGLEKVFVINQAQSEEAEQDEKSKKKAIKKFKEKMFGSQGTIDRVSYNVFSSLKEAKSYFQSNNINVCGVLKSKNNQKTKYGILPDNIITHPFKGDTVFIFGTQAEGLSPELVEICDQFIYVAKFSQEPINLNMMVIGSIVLQHFASWANLTTNIMYYYYFYKNSIGEKFRNERQPKEFLQKRLAEQIDQQQNGSN